MGNQFITKGSTITIGSGATDVKAITIADFEIGVGDRAPQRVEASDGTQYTWAGVMGDSILDLPILCVDDSINKVLEAIFGAGSTISGGTEWDTRNAGTTQANITITTPQTGSTMSMVFTAVNAKGVGLKPTFKLAKGFEAQAKFVCDYWKIARKTS